MSCPVCNIDGGAYVNIYVKPRKPQNNSTNKGPSRFSTYPEYPGPQDSVTLANERALDYPYIHAKIYNRTPSPEYLQLKAMAAKERADDEKFYNKTHKKSYPHGYSVRDALSHLDAAQRLLRY